MTSRRVQVKVVGIAGQYAFLCSECRVYLRHIAQSGEFVRRECPKCGYRIITYENSIIN